MNKVQKLKVAKVKRNNEGQYKTLYKVFDEYGKFLYYQVGADGEITEYLDDIEESGYLFYTFRFDRMKKDNIQ
ncbi:MAG: hypothetical protein QM793_06690 [Muricomes sp.]